MSPSVKQAIRRHARDLGFDACGFADVSQPWAASDHLAEFLAEGRHGEMTWLQTTALRRSHPRALWPDARSAVVLGLNYGPRTDPRLALEDPSRGAISVYAQGDDYHDLIKRRLKALAGALATRFDCEVKVFVDTAPLMEKPLAQAAGLGWQGKHTNLLSRAFGSWLLLGAVLTTLELAPDPPEVGGCGACRACLDACPTDAFPAPYQLDARRCISYLTIEYSGPIPHEFRAALGSRIYGCDDCLAVCPWNKFASVAQESRLHARDNLRSPTLESLAALDDESFRALFAKSPVKRLGRDRFVRNVLYAIGNSNDASLACAVYVRTKDASPLVRGAAVWALGRLLDAAAFARLASDGRGAEADPAVQAEWNAGLSPSQRRSREAHPGAAA